MNGDAEPGGLLDTGKSAALTRQDSVGVQVPLIVGKNIQSQRHSIMPIQNESPYIAHVFVCTNDRGGERKSCADGNSQLVKEQLKKAVDGKGWKGKVRVSTSGCMGVCAQGANVMIYPQKVWFSGVSPDDVDAIVAAIEQIMAQV
jgi:(2Fe-2S) ferredoxin